MQCYFTQLSIFKFVIRINSFSLLVTRMQPIERACAAINISREAFYNHVGFALNDIDASICIEHIFDHKFSRES